MSTESNTAKPQRDKRGVKLKTGIKRWHPDEYLQMACAMLPLIAKGKTKLQSLQVAQRLLPKARQRLIDDLGVNARSPLMKTALAKAADMGSDAREALLGDMQDKLRATLEKTLKPEPEPKPTGTRVSRVPATYGGTDEKKMDARGHLRPVTVVRWNDKELALVARRVAYFQRELQDKRVLSRLIKVAQDIELPPERRRSPGGIDSGLIRMREDLIRGFTLIRTVLADVPFDPNLRAYPEPLRAAVEFIDPVKSEVSESPGVNIDGPRKVAPQAAQAPEPVSAPTPPPQPHAPVSEPIRAFGEVFAQGMSDLIQGMTRQLMSELEARIGAASERLMQSAIDTMARGVTTMVHSALERELGGPVETEQPAQSFALPEGAALPATLQLDVVGLIGSQITEVKSQLNGHSRGIRFIDADQLNAWTPRGLAIINTKFISHSVEGKCRKAGVKPIRVQGGAGAIVNAIKELYAQEGVALPH